MINLEYRLVKSIYDIQPLLTSLNENSIIAIDTETTGLDPIQNRIRTIQIATQNQPAIMIDLWGASSAIIISLKKILASPALKVFHNAKFDLKFLRNSGFFVQGPYFDTMLAAQILSAGQKIQGFKLSDLVQEELKIDLPKELQNSDWKGELSSEQINYAVRDAQVLLEIYPSLLSKLENLNLYPTAELEFDCLPAVVDMELSGMYLHVEKWEKLTEELENIQNDLALTLRQRLNEGFKRIPQLPFMDNLPTEPPLLNLDSPKQMLEALQRLGIPLKTTSHEELSQLSRKFPVIQALIDYRKVTKVLQSFASTLPKFIHPVTRRIHPDYWQIGTATGRFSCRNPNLQQIPRDKVFRECFIPAEGKVLIIGDYSQVELRVAAEISRDQRMIDAFQQNQDIHCLTASLLIGKNISSVTKEERQAAKAVNFGLLYAMGARGLKLYAQNSYNVEMTDQQAIDFRKRFFEVYQGIASWQKELSSSHLKEIRTLNGRLRSWEDQPKITELFNTPIQGTAADIIKQAMAKSFPFLYSNGIHLIGTVHDEILLESPQEKAEEASHFLKETMINAGKKFIQQVPIEVDVVIANNWSEK
ncbi:MAG: bifunctional 3'-5' exonuclease/DNA polymerase [Candidatus Atribacteria bacterium]|nr:bifunctional 3'-5' exonuclease/DNA polymerase [Candidatus Atribacteria bacterium]